MESNAGVSLNLCNDEELNLQMAEKKKHMLYEVEEDPPFIFSLLAALQMVVCQAASLVWLPLALTPSLCLLPADPVRVYLVSSALLVSGIVTVLQSSLGIRLPTVVVPSVLYVSGLLAVLRDPTWQCPSGGDLYAMPPTSRMQQWQLRLCEVQGVLLFAGLLQTLLGITGLQACLLRTVSPVVLAAAVLVSGCSLSFHTVHDLSHHWTTDCSVILIFLILVVLGLRRVVFPLPTFSFGKGLKIKFFHIFQMFPVLWICVAVYIFYRISETIFGRTLEPDKGTVAFEEAVDNAKWMFVTLPLSGGWPSLSLSSVVQMLPVILLQSLLSGLLFHCNASTCEVPRPPRSAVGRGLAVEGAGLLLGALWGHAVTASPTNTALTYFTGVASRSSAMLAGLLLVFLSLFTCTSSTLANIPLPILGATQLSLMAGLVCVGVSMLKATDLSSRRECSILGICLFLGLIVPQLVTATDLVSETGYAMLDSFINQYTTSSLLVCVVTGCALEFVLPGKLKRNNCIDKTTNNREEKEYSEVYQLPTWEEIICKILDLRYRTFYDN